MSNSSCKNARVVRVRPAGDEHRVLTVADGPVGLHRRKPCGGCPWRRDRVGDFPADAFRHSAETSYDLALTTFACHESGARRPAICAGFLLRNADHNLAVRLAIARGELDPTRVSDAGLELFGSYRQMAIANGVDPDDPVLVPCRANGYGDPHQ